MCGVKPGELKKWIAETQLGPHVFLQVLSAPAGLDLLLTADHLETIGDVTAIVKKRWGTYCYSLDGESLEEVVGRLLLKRGKRIAVAESCTGGRVAARLTRIPGSSRYFESACVTYSNRSKERLLSVPGSLLKEKGAVSPEVATAMAVAVRLQAGVEIGLAITGIAGPGGGTDEKPVGLVYIALSDGDKAGPSIFRFDGDRESIQTSAAQMALEQVRLILLVA